MIRKENGAKKMTGLCFLAAAICLSGGLIQAWAQESGLKLNFYEQSCPRAESMVRGSLSGLALTDPTSLASLLRLAFHDCQVQGCDASIMLQSKGNITSELVSANNFGIRRLNFINRIKNMVERMCPGVVSCSDIIILAARDAVAMSGGPQIPVLTGRRDSTYASNTLADSNLLPATATIDQALKALTAQNFTTTDIVALLGGHTLGVGHCISVIHRLYPKLDPTISSGFGRSLKVRCPNGRRINNVSVIANDFTNLMFDNRFYKDISSGSGVLRIDQELAIDARTKDIAAQFSKDQNAFFQAFSSAFIKLSQLNVLTGSNGQIRKQCDALNS